MPSDTQPPISPSLVEQLLLACKSGDLDTVRSMLAAGVKVNVAEHMGRSPLLFAAYSGHFHVVKLLLQHKADVGQTDHKGCTPLCIACTNGCCDVIQILIDHKADVNQPNNDGFTPLYVASEKGHCDVVKILLDHNADVNQPSNNGFTPLYIASRNAHSDVVSVFVDHNANINQPSNNGFTPLYIACGNGSYDVVTVLVDHNADVNQPVTDAFTPLYIASRSGHSDVVRVLVDDNANVNQPVINGFNPLHIASEEGHHDVVQVLLDHNVDVNQPRNDGVSALCAASGYGHCDVVQLLIKNNAHLNQPSNEGITPLYIASQNGHLRIVNSLLEAGASSNKATETGFTPLIRACQAGHLDVAHLLLRYGADMDHASVHGVTALFAACCHHQLHIIREFNTVERVATKTDLGHSCLHATIYRSDKERLHLFQDLCHSILPGDASLGNSKVKKKDEFLHKKDKIEVVKLLLNYLTDVNDRNYLGETAFFLACSQGLLEIAEFLYANIAAVTVCDYEGTSPLSTAVIHGRVDTVRWLLSLDEVDVNHTDGGGHTALFRACELNKGNEFVLEILLQKGAKLNKCNNDNISPLSVASFSGNVSAVKYLLQHDADVHLTDEDGFCALHMACIGGHEDIADVLHDHGMDQKALDSNGNTPLHTACAYLQSGCVEALLHADTVNIQNHVGESPLHVVCCVITKHSSKIVTAKRTASIKIVSLLLLHEADVNMVDINHETPLFSAIKHDNTHLADLLVLHGADVKALAIMNRTLIHVAAMKHTTDITSLSWTLNRGIDIDARDVNGHTALHLAALSCHSDVFISLFHHGADYLAVDKCGITPLTLAAHHPKMFTALMEEIESYMIVTEKVENQIMQHAVYHNTINEVEKSLNKYHYKVHVDRSIPNIFKQNDCLYGLQCFQSFKGQLHNSYSSSQKMCSSLLQIHGTLLQNSNVTTVVKHLDTLMNSLVEGGTGFKPVLCGSIREETKVVEVNEADYVFEYSLSPQKFHPPTEYQKSFIRIPVEHQPESADLLTESRHLSRKAFFRKLYYKITGVLASPTFWDQFPMFYRLSSNDVRPDDQSIRHLDLIYHDDNYPWLKIQVDLTPAIAFPDWYPPWCIEDPLHQRLLKQHGCRAVAKWIPAAHNDPTLFRLCFGSCNTALLNMMPVEYKEAYKLGKILMAFCPHIESLLEEPHQYITSYHLKTCILWIFYEEYLKSSEGSQKAAETDIDMAKVVSITREVFDRLSVAYQKQWLEFFWIPDENLLLDPKYGQYGWCASNYAKFIRWLLEPGLDDLPQFISAEDCTPEPTVSSNQTISEQLESLKLRPEGDDGNNWTDDYELD